MTAGMRGTEVSELVRP